MSEAVAEQNHQVFISYSSRNRERADAICAVLEAEGLRCWIAPRDGKPGESYASFLVEAIAVSRIVVLVFSQAANDSEAVLNELELAANRNIPVLPVRIESVQPSGAAEYYLRRRHWLDAFADFDAVLPTVVPAVRAALAGRATVRTDTQRRRQSNVPRQETSFVGRDRELAELGSLIGEHRLVTLVGPGGVGKTRLSLQVALEVADLADGPWLIDLAPLSSPDLIATTILSTIGMRPDGDADPISLVCDALGERATLLVLDNCEHVISGAARVVEAILARCPNATLLATSREGLNLRGEHVYRLHPLDAYASVRLFAERAHAANARFELGPENEAVVEAICRRLDHLALAIELAAARVRVISVEELARRLSDRFRLLTGGNRSALPHQQTMRALIDWSYETLSDTERALFRIMGCFAGSFSLEALGEVAEGTADPWDTLDLVTSLVDKSLVTPEVLDHAQRYYLLQSIQDYAVQQLAEQGESEQALRRHGAYFAAFFASAFEEFDKGPEPDWLARVRLELNNARAALNWALQPGADPPLGAQLAADAVPLFLRTSLLQEGIGWCERALATPELSPATSAQLHYGLSMLYNNRAALPQALEHAARAAELLAELGAERQLVRALSQQAQLCARIGRLDEALQPAEDAIAGARRSNDTLLLAATLRRSASAFAPRDIERARACFSESVRLFSSLHRTDETLRALEWWAAAEAATGSFERAITIAGDALKSAERDEDRLHQQNIVATCALALDDRPRALGAVREMLALAARVDDGLMAASAVGYAAALRQGDDAELAARLLGYAEAQLAALGAVSDATDQPRLERLEATLRGALGEERVAMLRAEGALWSERRALDQAALP